MDNLTLYVEPRWKRELTWQVIDLEAASVDDLLQAPVLFFAGGENPLPPGDQRQQQLARKLRDYLDRGGFLLAEADCCSTGFDEGFRQLMKLVFPEPEYAPEAARPGASDLARRGAGAARAVAAAVGHRLRLPH